MNKLIDDMFSRICNDVNTANLYGFKNYTKDVKYVQFWRDEFTNKVVKKLRDHYVDSTITSINGTIHIDWSFTINENDVYVNDETEENVKINITLPARIQTRSSSKR